MLPNFLEPPILLPPPLSRPRFCAGGSDPCLSPSTLSECYWISQSQMMGRPLRENLPQFLCVDGDASLCLPLFFPYAASFWSSDKAAASNFELPPSSEGLLLTDNTSNTAFNPPLSQEPWPRQCIDRIKPKVPLLAFSPPRT